MKTKNINRSGLIKMLCRKLFVFATLTLVLILPPALAHALTPITVAWDANDPVPAGYILYWGTSSGNYTSSHDAGDVTQYTIPDLQEGITYFFAATAYNDAGAESALSEEISHTVSLGENTHTITASAGVHGSISPAGPVTVNNGDDQSFSIIPDQYYRVADVVVDGSSVGGVTTHTFEGVDRDHTILASFVAVNQPPVSDAGSDLSVWVSDTVHLDGSNSDDANGDGLTYHWSFVVKPGGSSAVLSDTAAVKPNFIVDVPGIYTVRLIVNDGTVNSAPDTVTVSTQNSAPASHAGSDQTALVTDTVQLDGSASSDIDGDSLTFAWALISKPNGSSATLTSITVMRPALYIDIAGSYTVRLIVNDGTVNSAPDTVTISTQNSAPVSHAGADQTALVNDRVQLDGSTSSDVDGDMLTFEWSLVARPNGSSATLTGTTVVQPALDVDVTGSYTVRLIVNDGTVTSAPDTVTISTENSAPVSHAGADQAVMVNDAVQLDGSASRDVDGDTLTFMWSFIARPDGSSAVLSDTEAVTPTFNVDVAGTYALQLIVNDGTVNSVPDAVTISTENSAPLSSAGADQAVLVNDRVQLDGSGSSDADGDTLTFAWAIVSKPGGSSAVLSDTEAVRPTFTVDVAGTYAVQLIVNDGTDNSAPDTLTIITENSPPVSHAGADQFAEEGDLVTLSGSDSNDIDKNIASYSWKQTAGTAVEIIDPEKAEATFIAPDTAGETVDLTFELTVKDTQDLQDVDTCVVRVTGAAAVDSDGDGVPDDQDAFPSDPAETTDTDGDGTGNNADDDDDGDGMPDAWEIVNNLDPLVNDAAGDPDDDGISNIDEYTAGTGPFTYEDPSVPDVPVILTPLDNAIVSLTPELTADEFYDPDTGDVHAASQWQIFRTGDNFCVLDVTSPSSLTALKVPKLILEENTDYSWKVRFKNNHDAESGWSDSGYFTTDLAAHDANGNGIPDDQEVAADLDLDKDGVMDSDQIDIKCVDNLAEDVQIGVSIKDAENVTSIVAMELEDAGEAIAITKSKGKPKYAQLGLINFKIVVNAPGDETVVAIHLSNRAIAESILYKYDPINAEWLDYSDYAEFSPNRKVVYLTLEDGGFGDADGIENGIIVDPLTVGTEIPVSYGSDGSSNPVAAVGEIVKGVLPEVGCFISTAVQQPEGGWNFWSEVRGRELAVLFILIFFGYIGKSVCDRKKNCHRDPRNFTDNIMDRIIS